jgi:hypothetical protein
VTVRSSGLEVRAHVRPRPHLHIAPPDDLAAVRPGVRLSSFSWRPAVTTSARALAVPLVLLGMALSGTAGLTAEPSPGSARDLTSTKVETITDPAIDEASGMVASQIHPGLVWIVNDSKGGAVIHGVDDSGEVVADLSLRSVYNRDWEAMAPGVDDHGDPALWVADIGDNDARWDSVRVFRISEPASLGDQTVQWRRVELKYPDGPHNAESFMVTEDGRLVVVTKEALGAGVYVTPTAPEFGATVTLERVGPAPMFLTDGAISPDGKQVALRSYTSLYLYDAHALLTQGTRGDAGSVYPLPLQPQGETLAYTDDGHVLIGTEGVDQPLYLIGLPQEAKAQPATKDEPRASSSWVVGIVAILLVSGATALIMRARGRRGSAR